MALPWIPLGEIASNRCSTGPEDPMRVDYSRVILLAYGQPGHGKSYLADKLKTEHSFGVLSVDETYVEFIRSRCPMLYFEALEYYVGPHYFSILGDRGYSKAHFRRDFVAEWHSYLKECIEGMAARHDRLIVEGDLLRDCKDQFEVELRSLAQVFQIKVVDQSYRWQGRPISLTQIAALGENTA
jgi:hypothetical protein